MVGLQAELAILYTLNAPLSSGYRKKMLKSNQTERNERGNRSGGEKNSYV